MHKTTIAAIAAALLLAAVICTAGCVNAPSDPIVGTYVAETDSAVSYAFFEEEGTGLFTESAETVDAAGVLQGTFDWTAAEPKNTYTLTFADGRAVTAVLNAQRGLMTIGEVVFEKEPSELSGASVRTREETNEMIRDLERKIENCEEMIKELEDERTNPKREMEEGDISNMIRSYKMEIEKYEKELKNLKSVAVYL